MKNETDRDWSDDPRITAYALGEMEEGERVAFEQEIEGDEAAQVLVAELQTLGRELEVEFAAEGAPALSVGHRRRIEEELENATRLRESSRQSAPRWGALTRVAAALIIGIGIAAVAASILGHKTNDLIGTVAGALPSSNSEDVGPILGGRVIATSEAGDGGIALDFTQQSTFGELYGIGANGMVSDSIWGEDSGGGSGGGGGGGAWVGGAVGSPHPFKGRTQKLWGYESSSEHSLVDGDATVIRGLEGLPTLEGVALTFRSSVEGPSRPADQEIEVTYTERLMKFWNRDEAPPGPADRYDDPDGANREQYAPIFENPFLLPTQAPLSTFSIDVDTASYANVRRFLESGQRPPPDAVRIEEMVNYFKYDYAEPDSGAPFSVDSEVGACPWEPRHRLVRIGLKGRSTHRLERPASNLVFLIDVSGSMNSADKLPLLKKAMHMLVQQLGERDLITIVVYAGSEGLALPPTRCTLGVDIHQALERLSAGGSTNGGAGIELAYRCAVDNFIEGGINRVILATDGDFNVGTTSDGALVRLIEEKAKSGVFLSVLGFGTGNLQDAKMEQLADRGNGNYSYIDSVLEARKVLVEELGSTLETIAKDVKIQVEFNPVEVKGYRLIGYENRLLAAQDFNDDKKDAGEIGAGHTVTALYEVVPAGAELDVPGVDPLKYQVVTQPSGEAFGGELCTLKLRYKEPDGDTSRLLVFPVTDERRSFEECSENTRWAASVAAFGLVLRDSRYKGGATLEAVSRWAASSLGEDPGGYRAQFIGLVGK